MISFYKHFFVSANKERDQFMSDQRTTVYAKKLSCMISKNTVSCSDCKDTAKFREFHELLRKLFPDIFSCCEFEDHSGSFVMRWKGKSDIETHVIDSGMASPVTDHKSDAFKLIEKAIDNVFGHIKTIPYIMLGASDSCYISKVCNSCLRFTPFYTDDQQFASLHGKNENVYLSSLIPAVDFFRYIITEA